MSASKHRDIPSSGQYLLDADYHYKKNSKIISNRNSHDYRHVRSSIQNTDLIRNPMRQTNSKCSSYTRSPTPSKTANMTVSNASSIASGITKQRASSFVF